MPRSCYVWECTARGGILSKTRFYSFPNLKNNSDGRQKCINAVEIIVVSPNKCHPEDIATGLRKRWEAKQLGVLVSFGDRYVLVQN